MLTKYTISRQVRARHARLSSVYDGLPFPHPNLAADLRMKFQLNVQEVVRFTLSFVLARFPVMGSQFHTNFLHEAQTTPCETALLLFLA